MSFSETSSTTHRCFPKIHYTWGPAKWLTHHYSLQEHCTEFMFIYHGHSPKTETRITVSFHLYTHTLFASFKYHCLVRNIASSGFREDHIGYNLMFPHLPEQKYKTKQSTKFLPGNNTWHYSHFIDQCESYSLSHLTRTLNLKQLLQTVLIGEGHWTNAENSIWRMSATHQQEG